ncbi:hypothetical protein ACS0TY_004854 [Phlomoides rotata]
MYSNFGGWRKEITSIREYVNLLIPIFLENFPENSNPLEDRIRDLAHEAEDLIKNSMLNQSRMYWWSFMLSRVKLKRRLKRVREEIGSITAEMMDGSITANLSSRVASTGKKDVVIGLDDDLIAIKGRLCGESSKLEVIPIVGMGGIGKTTLAQNAYDDQMILEHFHIRAFVQVSQDYSAKEILSNLLASIKLFEEHTLGETNESEIAENVYKSLKGRRYLIVMDDIWSTEAWDDVRNIFPDDKNGSRIMLTTRLSDVAAYVSSSSPLHQMKFMDGSHSWNLLKLKVFRNGQDLEFPELEDMGKEIARGCRGLPLAIVLVAGILSTVDKTRASWEEIGKNINSVVDRQLDEILSLSYMHLPHHLRPCFLFMAAIPEDHSIRVSRLIKLWVAEGFLKGQGLEEKAEEYVEDLVKRSLVLVTSWKSNGKIKSCSLHDLVRDMCIRKAEEEEFLLTDRYVLINARKHERRISIGHPRLNSFSYFLECCITIHTILFFRIPGQTSLAFLVRFRLLRVLDIMRCSDVLVPPQVFELIHLKYLALGFPFVIPAAISNLRNLQTLIIGPKAGFSDQALFSPYLPLEIWRMPQLKHLIFYDSFKLPDPADGPTSLPLENLQTLSFVRSFACRKRNPKMFPNLKKLGLVYFKNVDHLLLHNLKDLHQLEKMKITAKSRSFSCKWQIDPVYPSSLKKLTLEGWQLGLEGMRIVGSLPNLQVLKLKDCACDGDTWETTDGEFPQLQYLRISRSNLQHWITEDDPFPRLKCLVLYRCPYLNEIPDSIGEIPTLEQIKVDVLNRSLMKSAKEIQRVQREYGNEAFQTYCIHTMR